METKNYIEVARGAAREAGEILLSFRGNIVEQTKNLGFEAASVVTEADLASEKRIKEILLGTFPEHSFHGEESGDDIKNSPFKWVVDPLDGTSNFIRNIPLFGVSIALLENDEPILGILYFPALNLFVEAEKGKGAFANDRKISVSRRPLEKALYYSGGKFRGEMQLVQSLASAVGLVKIIDASSYELAQIAMGDAELYQLESVLHDVAAGVCIVREAGGKITDNEGKPWAPDSKTIVISNGVIHEQVIELLKQ